MLNIQHRDWPSASTTSLMTSPLNVSSGIVQRDVCTGVLKCGAAHFHFQTLCLVFVSS